MKDISINSPLIEYENTSLDKLYVKVEALERLMLSNSPIINSSVTGGSIPGAPFISGVLDTATVDLSVSGGVLRADVIGGGSVTQVDRLGIGVPADLNDALIFSPFAGKRILVSQAGDVLHGLYGQPAPAGGTPWITQNARVQIAHGYASLRTGGYDTLGVTTPGTPGYVAGTPSGPILTDGPTVKVDRVQKQDNWTTIATGTLTNANRTITVTDASLFPTSSSEAVVGVFGAGESLGYTRSGNTLTFFPLWTATITGSYGPGTVVRENNKSKEGRTIFLGWDSAAITAVNRGDGPGISGLAGDQGDQSMVSGIAAGAAQHSEAFMRKDACAIVMLGSMYGKNHTAPGHGNSVAFAAYMEARLSSLDGTGSATAAEVQTTCWSTANVVQEAPYTGGHGKMMQFTLGTSIGNDPHWPRNIIGTSHTAAGAGKTRVYTQGNHGYGRFSPQVTISGITGLAAGENTAMNATHTIIATTGDGPSNNASNNNSWFDVNITTTSSIGTSASSGSFAAVGTAFSGASFSYSDSLGLLGGIGFLFRRSTGWNQFDVGIAVSATNNPIRNAVIRDDGASLYSLDIRGSHATAAISVANGAGDIIFGENNAWNTKLWVQPDVLSDNALVLRGAISQGAPLLVLLDHANTVMGTWGAGGNIGIGTSSLSNRINISTSTVPSGGIRFGDSATSTDNAFLYRVANGQLRLDKFLDIGTTTSTPSLLNFGSLGASSANLVVQDLQDGVEIESEVGSANSATRRWSLADGNSGICVGDPGDTRTPGPSFRMSRMSRLNATQIGDTLLTTEVNSCLTIFHEGRTAAWAPNNPQIVGIHVETLQRGLRNDASLGGSPDSLGISSRARVTGLATGLAIGAYFAAKRETDGFTTTERPGICGLELRLWNAHMADLPAWDGMSAGGDDGSSGGMGILLSGNPHTTALAGSGRYTATGNPRPDEMQNMGVGFIIGPKSIVRGSTNSNNLLTTTISSSDLSLTLNAAGNANYPTGGGLLYCQGELIRYTSKSGTTFTIPAGGRGAYGTTPAGHTAGQLVQATNLSKFEVGIGVAGDQGGGVWGSSFRDMGRSITSLDIRGNHTWAMKVIDSDVSTTVIPFGITGAGNIGASSTTDAFASGSKSGWVMGKDGGLDIYRTGATGGTLRMWVSTDTFVKFQYNFSTNKIEWGGGSAAVDIALGRTNANILDLNTAAFRLTATDGKGYIQLAEQSSAPNVSANNIRLYSKLTGVSELRARFGTNDIIVCRDSAAQQYSITGSPATSRSLDAASTLAQTVAVLSTIIQDLAARGLFI